MNCHHSWWIHLVEHHGLVSLPNTTTCRLWVSVSDIIGMSLPWANWCFGIKHQMRRILDERHGLASLSYTTTCRQWVSASDIIGMSFAMGVLILWINESNVTNERNGCHRISSFTTRWTNTVACRLPVSSDMNRCQYLCIIVVLELILRNGHHMNDV